MGGGQSPGADWCSEVGKGRGPGRETEEGQLVGTKAMEASRSPCYCESGKGED